MVLTVVIPTFHRNDSLYKCLELLTPGKQALSSDLYEVIVTDDGYKTTAHEMINSFFPWVRYVAGPQRGPAANRNCGAKHARGEWLIFTDDDCLPTNNWLKIYYDEIVNNPLVQAFEGAIHALKEEEMKYDLTECPVNTNGGCFWSANIAIKKGIFDMIGGFNEQYKIAAQEDQQIKIDLEKHTHADIVFLNQCIVLHPVKRLNFWNEIKKMPIKSQNYILFVLKNNNEIRPIQFAYQQFRFHLSSMKRNLFLFKIKSGMVSLCWVIIGVPMNVLNLLRMRKNLAFDAL
jgi:glycosyltransferase involved in cell wall biosynthesis